VPRPEIAPRRPFQFTLRTMFLVTTVVAVVLGGLSVPEQWEWVRVLTMFYVAVAVPIVAVTALVYGRGYVRTFALGALFPAAAILGMMMVDLFAVAINTGGGVTLDMAVISLLPGDDPEQRRVTLMLGTGVATALILLGGLIAVVVRRMVQPRRTDWDPLKYVRESAAGDDAPTRERGTTPGHTPEEVVHDRS
jgi:hypothetical protein